MRVLLLLVLLGGGDPLGLLFASGSATAATAEEDDNIETAEAVVQVEHIEHFRPRAMQRSPFFASFERFRTKASGTRPAASTAWLAAINSPLNC